MNHPFLVQLLDRLPGGLLAKAALLYTLLALPYLAGSFIFGQFSSTPEQTSLDDGVVVIALFMTGITVFTIVLYRLLDGPSSDAVTGSRQQALATSIIVTAIAGAAPALELYSSGWNPYDISLWTWDTGTHRLLTLMIGWHLGRSVAVMLHNSRQLSAAVLSEQNFNLFDPAPLHAPVRQGLRNTLIVSSFAAIMAPFLIDPRYWVMVAVIAVMTVSFASLGMILPARGVARRMKAEKEKEMARLTPIITAHHNAMQNMAADDAGLAEAARNLEALISYRAQVEALREWPYDRSALSRFGLYLLFPLMSWVGAALVERLIDSSF